MSVCPSVLWEHAAQEQKDVESSVQWRSEGWAGWAVALSAGRKQKARIVGFVFSRSDKSNFQFCHWALCDASDQYNVNYVALINLRIHGVSKNWTSALIRHTVASPIHNIYQWFLVGIDRIQFATDYVKKFLNWLRTRRTVFITTVATCLKTTRPLYLWYFDITL